MDIPYQKITAVSSVSGAPNWRKIATLAGENRKRLILPLGVVPPKDSGVVPYDSSGFRMHMLEESAVWVVDHCKLQPYQKMVGLVDTQGVYTSVARRLVKHCAALKVYTQNPDVYLDFSQEIMELYGAPVILCDRPQDFTECILVLSLQTFVWDSPVVFSGPILAVGEQRLQVRHPVVEGFVPSMEAQIKTKIPTDIDPVDFWGGFLEYTGREKMAQALPRTGNCNGNLVTLTDIAAYVERKISKTTIVHKV